MFVLSTFFYSLSGLVFIVVINSEYIGGIATNKKKSRIPSRAPTELISTYIRLLKLVFHSFSLRLLFFLTFHFFIFICNSSTIVCVCCVSIKFWFVFFCAIVFSLFPSVSLSCSRWFCFGINTLCYPFHSAKRLLKTLTIFTAAYFILLLLYNNDNSFRCSSLFRSAAKHAPHQFSHGFRFSFNFHSSKK